MNSRRVNNIDEECVHSAHQYNVYVLPAPIHINKSIHCLYNNNAQFAGNILIHFVYCHYHNSIVCRVFGENEEGQMNIVSVVRWDASSLELYVVCLSVCYLLHVIL